jgi:ferredoxin-thioredoxin reductase catalytic subunit
MTTVDELAALLRKTQEPKGYFFNRDGEMVRELLNGLLANRARYGYMSCPCRLASGDREKDRDIVCPCLYRQTDVEAYGTCFCGLYATRAWNEGKVPYRPVPERRPPEKLF